MAKRLVTSAGLPAAPPPVKVLRALYVAQEMTPASEQPIVVRKRHLTRALDWLGGRRSLVTSFVASAVVHAVVLVLMGLWSIATPRPQGNLGLIASMDGTVQPGVEGLAMNIAPAP